MAEHLSKEQENKALLAILDGKGVEYCSEESFKENIMGIPDSVTFQDMVDLPTETLIDYLTYVEMEEIDGLCGDDINNLPPEMFD